MDPLSTSRALRLIAEAIELDDEPSISAVASDIREILQLVEGPDNFASRVAVFDTLKRLKRKVFKTKGQKKTQEKINRLKALQKKAKPLAKEIKDGIDFKDIMSEEDWVTILQYSSEFMKGGSEGLKNLANAKKNYEVLGALTDMDEFYEEHDDEELSDRKIIVDAISTFVKKLDDRILNLRTILEEQEKSEFYDEKEEAKAQLRERKKDEELKKKSKKLEKKLEEKAEKAEEPQRKILRREKELRVIAARILLQG